MKRAMFDDQCAKELAKNTTLLSLNVSETHIGWHGLSGLSNNRSITHLRAVRTHCNCAPKPFSQNPVILHITVSDVDEEGAGTPVQHKTDVEDR